jgi:putative Holliday junction resolvase
MWQAMPESKTVLAFDFGEQRIGVAVGESALRHTHPLTTINCERKDERFARIQTLIGEWRPAVLVVGRPVHLDGTPHAMTARCARFANQLRGRFGIPVTEVDERLTSVDAASRLGESGLSARDARGHIDAVAAQIILQGYFDAHCL